jgi:hypothetical protein
VFFTSSRIVPSVGSLTIFKSIFFCSCCLHITVLQSSLIRSSPSVRRCNYIMETFWEVVKLDTEVRHSVHRIYIGRIGIFLPNLSTDSLLVYETNFVIPITFNRVHDLFCLSFKLVDLANQLELFFAEPATAFESDFASLFWFILVCYVHSVTYVNIHSADD